MFIQRWADAGAAEGDLSERLNAYSAVTCHCGGGGSPDLMNGDLGHLCAHIG